MNILIIGSGGREHALAWKVSKSAYCDDLYVAPGNGGTAEVAVNVDISVTDFDSLGKFSLENNIQLIIVGPELPLAEGIKDYFTNDTDLQKIKIIGPNKSAARLESSKDFAKKFMKKNGIPTARSATFTADSFKEGLDYIKRATLPLVIKADGPAAGKGVIIAQNHEEAEEAFSSMLRDRQFGDAGSTVVIEEYLEGIEVSVFALLDGKNYILLPEAKDYKRIGEGDTGPNTGGTGAVSPVPFYSENLKNKVEEKIIKPTLSGLKQEGMHYNGFLFFGLMIQNNEPYLLEYNVRLGDPETQAVLPRIKSDFIELIIKSAEGKLSETSLTIDEKTAAAVILMADGYPREYKTGKPINGLENLDPEELIFHAGTHAKENERITSGGRVMAVTGLGEDLGSALQAAYNTTEKITFEGMYFRKDIGFDLKQTEKII